MRSEMGAPPDLHRHFVALSSKNITQEEIDLLLDDVEEVELGLKKAELQMKNKDLDTLYYKELVAKTENEIMKCGGEIQKLRQELDE